MVTLTELKCLFDEWKMQDYIGVFYKNEYVSWITVNEALAYYGNLKVDHFNRTTVWLRSEHERN